MCFAASLNQRTADAVASGQARRNGHRQKRFLPTDHIKQTYVRPNDRHKQRILIMTRLSQVFLVSLVALTTLNDSAWACQSRCRPTGRPILVTPPANIRQQPVPPTSSPNSQRPLPPAPAPAPAPTPSPNGLTANDVIINDLPAEAKLAIRAAATAGKVRMQKEFRQSNRVNRGQN